MLPERIFSNFNYTATCFLTFPWVIMLASNVDNDLHVEKNLSLITYKRIIISSWVWSWYASVKCCHLIHVFRTYCPSVITMDENHLIGRPRTQLSLMLKSKKGLHRTSSSSPPGGSVDPSWLYPILLPTIFPTLFALYKEHHSEDDCQLTTLMEALNQSSDKELCSILGLQRLAQTARSQREYVAKLKAVEQLLTWSPTPSTTGSLLSIWTGVHSCQADSITSPSWELAEI